MTESPHSRTEAEQNIRSLLQPIVCSKQGRALVCADFAYGYPAGFASLLRESMADASPPWRIVWQYLKRHLRDDLGTASGRQPTRKHLQPCRSTARLQPRRTTGSSDAPLVSCSRYCCARCFE
jgi:hypothetical protein